MAIETAAIETAAIETAAIETAHPEETRKILVVDDDESIRTMLRIVLELEGFQVMEAADGREGIEKASFVRPHLILLDLMMPSLDGFEVCRRLRRNRQTQELPVVMVSVRGSVDDKVNGLGCGADDYITKPFDPVELVARVRAHLRKMEILWERNQMMERLAGKLAAMNLDLREQAVTDGLTGLYNHRHFIRRLQIEVERVSRYGGKFSLILFDLDHFKRVNDRLGHLAGDAVLRETARLLQKEVRGVDLVARYGGEEFVLLLPETPPGGAQVVADRIRARLGSSRFDEISGEMVTVSGGVATFPVHAESADDLLRKTDEALYRAKREGRNRIFVWGGG